MIVNGIFGVKKKNNNRKCFRRNYGGVRWREPVVKIEKTTRHTHMYYTVDIITADDGGGGWSVGRCGQEAPGDERATVSSVTIQQPCNASWLHCGGKFIFKPII